MLLVENKLWNSRAVPIEAPAERLQSCAEASASRMSAAIFPVSRSPAPTPLFCGRKNKTKNALPTTVAFTKEVSSEALEGSHFGQQDASKDGNGREMWKIVPDKEENVDQRKISDFQQSVRHFPGSKGDSDDFFSIDDAGNGTSNTAESLHLRLDALDMQRDFRGHLRPLLDVDSPPSVSRSKPGKKQNVPPKARQMILSLRDLPVEDFAPTLKALKFMGPDRADWLYVLRYFREKEDKSMLLEVFKFVLLLPAFKASARDYTNLIKVFVQLQNAEAVESTLKLMSARGVLPDLVTFTVVIGMYGRLGNLDMVKSKVEEMKLCQLEPDAVTYCAIIEAYCRVGYAAEAEMLLEKMEHAAVPLKNQLFISLIKGYGNVGRVQDAERLFQLMQAKLLYPDRRSYSALMDAYSKDEDVKHAIEVFNNMVPVGIEPTDSSLARLLMACEKKNMLPEAMEIVEKLESRKFKYGTKMLISWKGWLAKLELDEEVAKISLEVEKRLKQKAYVAKKWNMRAFLPTSYCL